MNKMSQASPALVKNQIPGYRTKRVDENRSTAREIKTVGRFNLFQNNFEGGQNVLIKML